MFKTSVFLPHRSFVVASLLSVSLAFGFFLTPPAIANYQESRSSSTITNLCGKLIFLKTVEGANLLGLLPCVGGKPYIFGQHPAELFKYYRINDAVIKSGTRVDTVQYGYLSSYITKWDGYIQLNSCSECNTGPKPTSTATVTSTETVEPIQGSSGGLLQFESPPFDRNFQYSLNFGANTEIFTSTLGHSGIDVIMPISTTLYTPAPCNVFDIRTDSPTYGQFVILEFPDNSRLFFGNMSQILVQKDQQLEAGTTLGLSGNTGLSYAPHLHLEYLVANVPTDPMPLLK